MKSTIYCVYHGMRFELCDLTGQSKRFFSCIFFLIYYNADIQIAFYALNKLVLCIYYGLPPAAGGGKAGIYVKSISL
jgi:hypothetical protein